MKAMTSHSLRRSTCPVWWGERPREPRKGCIRRLAGMLAPPTTEPLFGAWSLEFGAFG
jgi:hypothetical protein